MVFEDVSHERRSEIWKSFWFDKKELKSRCEICFKKDITTIYAIKKGNTKTMADHLKRAHDPENPTSLQRKRSHFFEKNETVEEAVTKLALDGMSFRVISQSQMLGKLAAVSFQILQNIFYKWERSRIHKVQIF